jgi:phage terminase large subunit GpA-like protein
VALPAVAQGQDGVKVTRVIAVMEEDPEAQVRWYYYCDECGESGFLRWSENRASFDRDRHIDNECLHEYTKEECFG